MSHTTDHDRPVAVMTAAQEGMLWGSLVSDALAMPAHWYYQRDAITRDYGVMGDYRTPTNPHPDSILWRSHYEPLNDRGEISMNKLSFGASAAFTTTSSSKQEKTPSMRNWL